MERITGQLPALSGHTPTMYGPWPYYSDTRGVDPIARVNVDHTRYQDCERLHPGNSGLPGSGLGWTRCFRMVDLPRMAEECRAMGVDPEGVYLTIFDGPYVPTTWAKSKADADRLRLHRGLALGVDVEAASKGVVCTYIGEDQRAMYRAVLAA